MSKRNDECPFCEPADGTILDDDGAVRILADKFPLNPGHCLITPHRHFARWDDSTPAERRAMLGAIDRVMAIVRRRHVADGFNVGWNDGAAAGQTIGHFHIHVVPRITSDVPDPRGGVRWVVPQRAPYWQQSALPADLDLLGAPHAEGLVTGDDDPLLPHLASCFAQAARVDIAVAFVMRRGVELLRAHLQDLLALRADPGRLRLITGDYLSATDPDGLEALLDLPGDRVLRVFEARERSFHPKAYVFHMRDGRGIAFVGSSNLSQAALESGVEWNYRIMRSHDQAGFASIARAFEQLFEHSATRDLTHRWIADYRARRRVPSPQAIGTAPDPAAVPPTPHTIQREALDALASTRAAGNTAGLVVLATGLGKTWLAAFDSQPFGRVLFVAHREEILDQAIQTFRRIRPDAALGKFTGTAKVPEADVLFASVQTLARAAHIRSFPADHFGYVVVDEFHHAAARSYRRLLDHFTPRFLLGLTATPERTDGADLLALCGHNLVHRADLAEGIRRGLLSPFRYLGVPDEVDYAQIPWRSNRFEEEALTAALATQARARNALQQFEQHAGRQALGFCCSQRHADFMARFFNDHGKRAAAVHAGATSAPRTLTLEALKRGDLDIVFSVDMFNEGVDVPAIDTVLMLRPTESRILWLQQLGRGLRKTDGKDRLQVIDYIGNHRTFLTKPQALFGALCGLGEGDEALRTALADLRRGDLELPPGCEVTYELVETLLDDLLRPKSGVDALRASYEDFRERHGQRPTAAELHTSHGLPKQTLHTAFGSWFGLVRALGDLTIEQEAVIGACGDFLRELEVTRMERSFKMLTLQALLAAEALPGSLPIEDLARGVDRIARRSPLLLAEVEASTAKHSSLAAMLRANPVTAWSHSRFFRFEDDRLISGFHIGSALHETLRDMVAELVDWRLAEYLGRRDGEWFECRVFSNQRDPILKLPDRSHLPDLPEGAVPVWADGRRFDAWFAKIAINRVSEPGADANALPGLLRSWFGAEAGRPGRGESVVFEREADGYRMRPRHRRVSEDLRVHDDRGHELDATFRVERTGDALSVVFLSRGGTKGSKAQRNTQYNQGLEVILARLAGLGATLDDAFLDSTKTASLPPAERRLTLEGTALPVNLGSHGDPAEIRRLLGQARARAGRTPGAKGSGNSTKTIRLCVSIPVDVRDEGLGERLGRPEARPAEQQRRDPLPKALSRNQLRSRSGRGGCRPEPFSVDSRPPRTKIRRVSVDLDRRSQPHAQRGLRSDEPWDAGVDRRRRPRLPPGTAAARPLAQLRDGPPRRPRARSPGHAGRGRPLPPRAGPADPALSEA